MNTQEIRKMISEASQVEARTGIMKKQFTDYARLHNIQLKEKGVNDLVKLVKAYIEYVPNLLDEAERASRQTGWWNAISPMLEAAKQYFFDPNDLIPDRLGLLGLTDDAYLAHSLLQTISERYEAQTGKRLLSEDLRSPNAFMRNLLGEAAASILDNHVKTMVDGPSMQDVLQQLFALAGSTNMMLPDVSFGGLSASEYANLQADLIITS